MKKNESKGRSAKNVPEKPEQAEASPGTTRREFLARLGGAAAVATAAGQIVSDPPKAAAQAAHDHLTNVPIPQSELVRRRKAAYNLRVGRAKYWYKQHLELHKNNGDESLYPNRIGNFSKGLPHNSLGEVDPGAYEIYLHACETGRPEDFDAIPLGTHPNGRKIRNPQAGFAFNIEGADSHQIVVPPAPAFASAQLAGEAVELYWASLLRDVNFNDYAADATVLQACVDLSALSDFRGPHVGGLVTPETIFRSLYPEGTNGPMISQFLLKDFFFGSNPVPQVNKTFVSGVNYLTVYDDWLAQQNGGPSAARQYDPTFCYIRNGRDLANWVDRDPPAQAGIHSTLILMGMGCPLDEANPYNIRILNQDGFTTFGPVDIFDMVEKAPGPAHRHGWFQKWRVHRFLRPEEFGGRVHNHATGATSYPLHADILNSDALAQSLAANGSYLLSQAYPDGCPLHTSYISGHSVGAGSTVTMLKALFDTSFVIPDPVQPSADGTALEPYVGPPLTVEGELNKLAWNIGLGRMFAGIHWRDDVHYGNWLGQESSIGILLDEKHCYTEPFTGYQLTKFDGTPITVGPGSGVVHH